MHGAALDIVLAAVGGGAGAALVVAVRAYRLAKDAYTLAVGHALDRTGHRRPIPLTPADPAEDGPPTS